MTAGFAKWAAAVLVAALSAAPGIANTLPADVLVRTVQKGEILHTDDFVSEDVSAGLARSVVSAEEAEGLEAKRTLREGTPVRASYLSEPNLVRRGDPVSVTLRSGQLVITATGKALADGAIGESVRVFSSVSNHTFDAVVEGAGKVRLIAR